MLAVISDVHGNLTAIEAVLADIKSKDVDRIICLGDTIGYGPNPCECMDLIRTHCDVVLCGNHEVAVLGQATGFRKHAKDALDWTRDQLKPNWITRYTSKGPRWDFLMNLVDSHREGDAFYVHGSPRMPTLEYIDVADADVGYGPSEKLVEILALIDSVCFVSHTHHPGVFTPDFKHVHPSSLDDGVFRMPEEGKIIVNVGSIGQPRDSDPRSCYVTVDNDAIQYHRVEYDVEKVIAEIERIDRLDDRIGLRLREGR